MKKDFLLFAVSCLIQFAILICRAQTPDQSQVDDQIYKKNYGPFTKLKDSTSKCICNFSKSGKIFNNYFKCDEHNGEIHVAIKRGYWIGTIRNGIKWNGINDSESDLVVGYCGRACHSYGSEVKGDYVPFNISYIGYYKQCTDKNHAGHRCKDCINGTYPSVNSHLFV